MKNRLKYLMQKASVAEPPEMMSKSGWVPFLPIIRILMEERGYTLVTAVHWLVEQGEIPASRHGAGYRALAQILARREAKKRRQQSCQQGLGALNPPVAPPTGQALELMGTANPLASIPA